MKKNTSKIVLITSLIIFTSLILLWVFNNKNSELLESPKDKVWLQLQWFNGSQFIGIYMAQHKGYFKDEDIELHTLEGGYNINPFESVRSNRATIGIATGDQILINKSEGAKYKAIGAVFNKSMACFMAKDNRIKFFTEIINKKAGVYKNYDTENILLSMLHKQQINEDSVNIVQAGNIESFFKDEIDFFPSYRFNEPIIAKTRNVSVKVFRPEDFGIDFYSDTFFCKEEFLIENKDLVKRFLSAVSKGWDYSRNNPSESVDFLIDTLNTLTSQNRNKIESELNIIYKHIGAGNNDIPLVMEKEKWENMESMLFKIGKIDKIGNIGSLCDFTLINQK